MIHVTTVSLTSVVIKKKNCYVHWILYIRCACVNAKKQVYTAKIFAL